MHPSDLSSRIAVATTLLFVPATRPDRFARALATSAGSVILDLEDAVPPDLRDFARAGLLASIAGMSLVDRARVLVRINAAHSNWHAADVEIVARLVSDGIAGAVLPKADSAVDISALASELGPNAQIVPLIESGAGLDEVDGLASAPGVVRLAFGHLDFMADMGMACDEDEAELVPARFAIARASRRARIAAPIDGVTIDARDAQRTARDAARSQRMGFGGKLCIHPDQIDPARAAFRATPAQVDWSQRVVAQADGGETLFMLDGKMVDAPVIALARRTLMRLDT